MRSWRPCSPGAPPNDRVVLRKQNGTATNGNDSLRSLESPPPMMLGKLNQRIAMGGMGVAPCRRDRFLKGGTCVAAARRRQGASRLVCHATRNPSGRKDYESNVTDKKIFQMHPATELSDAQVENCFGYATNFKEKYLVAEEIGRGCFGVVRKVISRETGTIYACKSIPKVPKKKRATNPHTLLKIRCEVDCMTRLGASLDAVFLKDVFEDATHVKVVMELCSGGALLGSPENSTFSEEEIADVMRAVFRFLAQCHSKGVVYRDVKPENFLFTDHSQFRRLKATDFGLATKWDPTYDKPLGQAAGTPIYISPETCKRCYGYKSDVYSAGVMCFQLLTGRYPYWPSMKFKPPTLHELIDLIKYKPIDYSSLRLEGVSDPAERFLKRLLVKDPEARPSAIEALRDPWLRTPDMGGLAITTSLHGTAVQRLQRFAVTSQLKQVVLTMIANNMVTGGTDITSSQVIMLSDLRDMFERVDIDQSGDVSLQELMDELMTQGYILTAAEVDQLMTRMDVNGDGTVDFQEFVSSMLDWGFIQRGPHWESMLRQVFETIDADGDGSISVSEIAALLPNDSNEDLTEKAKVMMRDFDTDNSGGISWEEFSKVISEGNTPDHLDLFDNRLSVSINGTTLSDAGWSMDEPTWSG